MGIARAVGPREARGTIMSDRVENADVARSFEESETRFRVMADCAPVLLWMADIYGLCTFFNQGWLQFTGRTMEQEYGNGWAESVHFEDFQCCMHTYMTAFVQRKPFAMEYRLRRADSQYRWVYDQGAPRFAADGTFAGYIGSCIDITDRREAHQALERLNKELDARVRERTAELAARVKEREILLREMHHRVKNNLQLVTSLLDMQARQFSEPRIAELLVECKNRVGTIGLIHEGLYQAEDLALVPFSEYAGKLSTNVFHAIGVSPTKVSLEVEMEDVALPVNQAIPCGLILNELLTNALKHAFPDNRRGIVRLELRPVGSDRLTMAVHDDGIGLPPNLVIGETRSLGLQIVTALAQQLEADLALEAERRVGTTVRITFRRDDRKP